MGLCLEAACKRKIWSRCLLNNSSALPSIINVIETGRLCAFAPPNSSLDRHSVAVFPRNVNNPGRVYVAGFPQKMQRLVFS